jgi:hypothetical protein
VLNTVLFYDNLSAKSCMTSKQSSPPFSVNCNKTLLNRNTTKRVLRFQKLFNITFGEFGNFSQSQLHTYLVKSHNNTFRGVNWKILRLSKVLLQFTEKGSDDCFDVIHGSVDKLS